MYLFKVTVILLLTKTVGAGSSARCVMVNQGKVCGGTTNVLDRVLDYYFGIPYAIPPVDSLRFQPPKRIAKWDKVVDGTKFGNSCVQNTAAAAFHPGLAEFFADPKHMSEDCLFLNIWSPRKNESDPALPVMVYIHGGSFTIGSGSLDIYNGEGLAAKGNVIYVSINYRLGMLGFAYLGTLEVPGNMGLMDQQMALEWIKENIAEFGGDPAHITLFGESAGGASVAAHLMNPRSLGLFSKAILQSGVTNIPWVFMEKEKAVAAAKTRVTKFGKCSAGQDISAYANCLRELSSNELTKPLPSGKPFVFDIGFVNNDGNFFNGNAYNILKHIDYSQHSIIIGSTADEAKYLMPLFYPQKFSFTNSTWDISNEEFKKFGNQALQNVFKDKEVREKIISSYDQSSKSHSDWLSQLLTEHSFTCPSWEFLSLLRKEPSLGSFQVTDSETAPKAIYAYIYNYSSENLKFPKFMGAFHSSDVPFVMGKPLVDKKGTWDEDDRSVSGDMTEWWANLAHSGMTSKDPIMWPRVRLGYVPVKLIDAKQSPVINIKNMLDRCKVIWGGKHARVAKEEL